MSLTLTKHDVHLWVACLHQPQERVAQLARTLSADEQERAERFHFERDQKRFIVARGVLRTILARYLDTTPDELGFSYGARGKPALIENEGTNNHHMLRFNLSHSQSLALYAITRDRRIGVDVEYIRPLHDMEQLAVSCFSPREYAAFHTLAADQKQEAFFSGWTRKEAYLKAVGDGMSQPLDQFDVSLVPGEAARLLQVAGNRWEHHRWSLQTLVPAAGYIGALAVEGHGWRLSRCEWPGALA